MRALLNTLLTITPPLFCFAGRAREHAQSTPGPPALPSAWFVPRNWLIRNAYRPDRIASSSLSSLATVGLLHQPDETDNGIIAIFGRQVERRLPVRRFLGRIGARLEEQSDDRRVVVRSREHQSRNA